MPPRLPGSSRPMGSKLGPDGLLDPKMHGLDPNKPKAVRIRKRDKQYGKCEHGRQRLYCRECGGKGICQHNRIRRECRDCKGKARCEHNRLRTTCKECHGGAICSHGRRRFNCKDCKREGTGGGGGICMHFKDKYSCKECSAAGIGGPKRCQHGKIAGRCVECGGPSICEHRRVKVSCKFCLKARSCIHNKKRNTCLDCKPIRDLGASGVSIKAHLLLTILENEKFYFHPRREELMRAIEELRKFALAHVPVPDPQQNSIMRALDIGRGTGLGAAGEGDGQRQLALGGEKIGDAATGVAGEHGTVGASSDGGAGAMSRPPGYAAETFLQEMSSKSLREIMDSSYKGEVAGKMKSSGGSAGAMHAPPVPPGQPPLPILQPPPSTEEAPELNPSEPLRFHGSLADMSMSDEQTTIPPEEYQKMMKAAHHLMAQHVLVMQEMKQRAESTDVDVEDVVLPCPHGKKSRLVCKSCRDESAAKRRAAKEEAAAAKFAASCSAPWQGVGGADGLPPDQGIKEGKAERQPPASQKKEPFHSLQEYVSMLNAAEFLMREHIKTTKELNTTAEERLREKQQYEELQRRSQEWMIKRMEGNPVPAVELAKIHHQDLLGLKVGPAPGTREPPEPMFAPSSGVPPSVTEKDGEQSHEDSAILVPVARRPDPNFVFKPTHSESEQQTKAAQERAEKIERMIVKSKEAKAKVDTATEQKKLKAKKRGRVEGEDPAVVQMKPADGASFQTAWQDCRERTSSSIALPQKPRIVMSHEQYLTIMRTGLLTRYQQEQYHEVDALIDIELAQYEKIVISGLLTLPQERAFQQQLVKYTDSLHKIALQQQMNLRLPSLGISQEVFDHVQALGLLKAPQIHEYPIHRRLMRVEENQLVDLKLAGVVSAYQEKLYEEARKQHKQYKIDYQTRLLALLQTPPHMQVEIPYLSISPLQLQSMISAGLVSPLQNDQYAKQCQEPFQYISVLPEQYQAMVEAGILSEAQKTTYNQQVSDIKNFGRMLLPGENPPRAVLSRTGQSHNQPPPPPPTKRMKKSEASQLLAEASNAAPKPAVLGDGSQGSAPTLSIQIFNTPRSAAEALQLHGNGSIVPGQPKDVSFAAAADTGLYDPQQHKQPQSQPPVPTLSHNQKAMCMHQQVACALPPPMSEAHCRKLVYQHVSWLQQRVRVISGADKGSGDPVSPADTSGCAAGAANATQIGSGGDAAGCSIAADGAGPEGSGLAEDSLQRDVEPKGQTLPGSVVDQEAAARLEAALCELQKLYDDGVLSKLEWEKEKELILTSAPLPALKANTGTRGKTVKFDKYHQTLCSTVLAILAPRGPGSASNELAAWDLVGDVMDQNHFIVQRWQHRYNRLVHDSGGLGSLPVQRKTKKTCSEQMKIEVASIIYSITAPYEVATKSGIQGMGIAGVTSSPHKKLARKRKKTEAEGKEKNENEAGEGEDSQGKKADEGNETRNESAVFTGDKMSEVGLVGVDNGQGKEAEALGKTAGMKKARKRRVATEGNGWKLWTDADGRKYYHHAERNITQWSRPAEIDEPEQPREPGQSVSLSGSITGPDLSHGWQEYSMPDGRKFYYHAASKKSQWTSPTETEGARLPVMMAVPQMMAVPGVPPYGAAAHWQYQQGMLPMVHMDARDLSQAQHLPGQGHAEHPAWKLSTMDLLQTWQNGIQRRAAAHPASATQKLEKKRENVTRTCVHGRRHNRCKDCGDVVICVHGKAKYSCKECRAERVCEHNKIKSRCNLCVCPHFAEQNKVGQCADCRKALRDKERGNGNLTDMEGRNMMTTDDEGGDGGQGVVDMGGARSTVIQGSALMQHPLPANAGSNASSTYTSSGLLPAKASSIMLQPPPPPPPPPGTGVDAVAKGLR